MATPKQEAAARRNIKKGRECSETETIARLPKKTRTGLGKQGAKIAKRKWRSR